MGKQSLSRLSAGSEELAQQIQGDFAPGLAVGRGAFVNGFSMQAKDHLDLSDYFATSRVGLKDLPDPAPESPPQRIDAFPAMVLGGVVFQTAEGQESCEALLDLAKSGLA